MTDEEFAAQKERVQPILDKWFDLLLKPNGWTAEFRFERTDAEILDEKGRRWGSTIADTAANWSYLYTVITIHCGAVKKCELDDEDLETILVHEFMHTLLNEMSTPKKSDNEERVATVLAKAFMRMTKEVPPSVT